MLFSACINPSLKSSIDLVILSYSNRREIVPLPRTYADTETLARQIFGLDRRGKLGFKTQDLDACGGKPAFINERAWDALRLLLSTIEIDIDDGERQLSSSDNEAGSSRPRSDSSSEADEKEEFVVLKSLSTVTKGKMHSVDEEPPRYSREQSPASPTRDRIKLEMQTDGEIGRKLLQDREPNKPEGSSSDPIKSLASVASDSGAGQPPMHRVPSDHAMEDGEQHCSGCPHVTSILDIANNSSQATITIKQEKARSVPVYQPISSMQEYSSASQQSQGDSASTDKFLVTIEHRATGKQALFRTRGDYPVSKVLLSACKSFKLEYERSNLFLVGEDGLWTRAKADDTMARAGARENGRFVVEDAF
ncbi:hypothetical protein OE88DRAFT_189296 [Heliocybe sulcata]|uniref:Uncharacterized protein n=1 Tax=Heliocybe sulcata TaxID=5364 RepID=A0A5C3N0R5_9AGAM|nr:hypothetical protein OE88DRAFT_189296 [Heliocybe sulcata]